MALYSDKVMDHFQNPRNVGKMDDADGIGEIGNAKGGDIMRMYIKVEDGVIIPSWSAAQATTGLKEEPGMNAPRNALL